MPSITLDLLAQVVNIKINSKGAHRPILWHLQTDNLSQLQAVDMTGYTARLQAYTDCAMATTPVFDKTTANGGLTIVSVPSKVFQVDNAPVTLNNVYGVTIAISNADSEAVYNAGEEGLHYLMYITAPGGNEVVLAKGMFTGEGVC